MPIDYAQYPPDWKRISWRIRWVRAGGKCECTGQCEENHLGMRCSAPNGELIHRRLDTPALWILQDNLTGGARALYGPPLKVILTVAHLCQDRRCSTWSHLLAMCQRCHLRYDRGQHAETRKKKKGR